MLEWIRTQPRLNKLIVIVFTSARYVGDVSLAYELGAKSFIIKPADFSQYLDIARLLKGWWLGLNQFPPIAEIGLGMPAIAHPQIQAPQRTWAAGV